MDITYCNEYLTQALRCFRNYWVSGMMTIIIFLFVAWILRMIAKYKLPKKKMKTGILLIALFVVVLSYNVLSSHVIPVAKDLRNKDYISVHGVLERYVGRGKGAFRQSYGSIKPDGQEELIHVKFITKNYTDEEKFPIEEELIGTVIYARESGIIIDFIPDS